MSGLHVSNHVTVLGHMHWNKLHSHHTHRKVQEFGISEVHDGSLWDKVKSAAGRIF